MADSLSRDAEITAVALFPMGAPCTVSFRRPHAIHARTRAALDELVAAGMIAPIEASALPKGAVGWAATKKIGFPLSRFRHPKKHESFPIVVDKP